MRKFSHEWYKRKYADVVKKEAQIKVRDKLKVYLDLSLGELKDDKNPVYDMVINLFPELKNETKLDEAVIMKLFDKVFRESSQKSIELLFKMIGALDDVRDEPNWEEVENATEGIK